MKRKNSLYWLVVALAIALIAAPTSIFAGTNNATGARVLKSGGAVVICDTLTGQTHNDSDFVGNTIARENPVAQATNLQTTNCNDCHYCAPEAMSSVLNETGTDGEGQIEAAYFDDTGQGIATAGTGEQITAGTYDIDEGTYIAQGEQTMTCHDSAYQGGKHFYVMNGQHHGYVVAAYDLGLSRGIG